MKIRSLTLTNVRKFAGQTAVLSGIGDGITVVSEANEFGKSTFFDALHALFFEKFGSTARPIVSLRPYSGGGVKVSAEIEHEGRNYAIEKRWLAQKGASVKDAKSGILIASDGEAEEWITRLMGQGRDGPAGMLWVRQGITSLQGAGSTAAEKAENERLTQTRRDLLSSVAGEIEAMTGGRRMDRVLQRCKDDLGKVTTTTFRPSGEWKTTVELVEELTGQYNSLQADCEALAGNLKARRETAEQIARLDSIEATDRRKKDLDEATRLEKEAKDYQAKIEAASTHQSLLNLQHDAAVKDLKSIEAAVKRLSDATGALSGQEHAVTEAKARVAETRKAQAEADERFRASSERLKSYRLELQRTHRREAAERASKIGAELSRRIAEAVKCRDEIENLVAKIAANKATQNWLDGIEKTFAEWQRLTAAQQAHAAQATMQYDGAAQVTLDGKAVEGNSPLPLPRRAVFTLPGIGKLHIEAGSGQDAEELDRNISAASDRLQKGYAVCGVFSVAEARDCVKRRQQLVEAESLAKGTFKVIAPKGIEDLQRQLAEATPQVEPAVEDAASFKDTSEWESLIAREETENRKLQDELARLTSEHARETQDCIRDTTKRDAALAELKLAQDAAGPEGELEQKRSAAAARVAEFQKECLAATSALEVLKVHSPDMLTIQANLARARSVSETAARELSKLRERRSELEGAISAQADNGVEERRDDIADQLAVAKARSLLFEAEVKALRHLQDTLTEVRAAAKDAYFGPVQEELAPLLRILHSDANLNFDNSTMLPSALKRGEANEDMEQLSGGTQEQIAILTRLAFANLFRKQGKTLPVILDDALVYTDDDRIIKMFTALHRVAASQQIIVFSCRQLAFAGLGGAKPSLEIRPIA